jgi:replicative DNA helicase
VNLELEDRLAATLATEESVRRYVFEFDPDDFHSRIAKEVVRMLKEKPNMSLIDLNITLSEKFPETYAGFLDHAGFDFEMKSLAEAFKRLSAKEKLRHLALDINDKLKDPEVSLDEISTMLLKGQNLLKLNSGRYLSARDALHMLADSTMDLWEVGEMGINFPLVSDLLVPATGGELVVVAGRPGMGKTTFMLTEAETLAREGVKVGFISLEMKNNSLLLRMAQKSFDYSLAKNILKMDPPQRRKFLDVIDSFKDLPMFFDDESQNVSQIVGTISNMAKVEDVRMVFIDYLQLIAPPKKASRNDEVAAISRALKLCALDNNITIVVGSQLSRNVERREGEKRPHLADLRDSGAIEQDADVVAFLYRKGYYNAQEDPEDVEFIVSKQRNGIVGTKHLRFDLTHQQFKEGNENE